MNGSGQAGEDPKARSGLQKPSLSPSRSRLSRLVRGAGIVCALLVGVPLSLAAALLVAVTFGPVDVSPALRPFLPISVVSGGKGRPPRGRLDVAHARLRWTGLRDGLGSPVLLELDDVRILDAQGHVADRIASGAVALDGFALLHGAVAPTDIRLAGARLALRRSADGAVDLDLPGTAVTSGSTAPAVDVTHLRRAQVSDAQIRMADDVLHVTWCVSPLEANLTPVTVRHRHGLAGHLTLGMEETPEASGAAPFQARLSGDGTLLPDGTLVWHARLDPTTPSGLAGLMPELAAVNAPIGLDATVTLGAATQGSYMLPRDGTVRVTVGHGDIHVAGSSLYTEQGALGLHLVLDTPAGRWPSAAQWPAHLVIEDGTIQLRQPPPPPGEKGALPPAETVPAETKGVAAAPGPSGVGAAAPVPVDVPPPAVTVGGHLDWASLMRPARMTGTLSAALSPVPFARLADYWPAHAAKGGRQWVTTNITSGMVRNLHVTLGIGTNRKGVSPDVISIAGGMDGEDMELHWLRPIAPLEGLDAHLAFLDLNTIGIQFDHGYQPTVRTGRNVGATGTGRLALGPGSMTIADLDKKDQMGTINVQLDGDLRDQLALLAEPRLHVLSRHPIPFTHPTGHALVRFTLTLPLRTRVSTDDMTLDGHAHMTHVHLGDVALGRPVDNGTVDAVVTMHGMDITGTGRLSHIPTDVRSHVIFDRVESGQAVDHVEARMHLTPDTVEAAGIPVRSHFSGRAQLDLAYTVLKDRPDTLNLVADMKDAGIDIPMWSKPSGTPASASALLRLDDGEVIGVEDLTASGPGLKISGEARFRKGHPPELILPDFRIGRSAGSATLTMPLRDTGHAPISVKVRARVLDLSPLVQQKQDAAKTPAAEGIHVPEAASGRVQGPPGRPWLIDLAADTLYYSENRALGDVHAYLDHNGTRLERLRFVMARPTAATVTIEPVGQARQLAADIPDFGAFLKRLGMTDMLEGGHARLNGHFDDQRPNAPFAGRLSVTPFEISKAPTAMLIVRSLSVYGWFSAKDHSKFDVERFEMPLSFADGVLHIHDGRAGNSALGATLQGPVNLDRGTLDLSGTIVPAFVINALPRALPGIGRLLAPEKGGGVLAVKFALGGKLDAPEFTVSPLTIFLPGVLRNML